MDISAARSAISALEKGSDSFSTLVEISTVLVVVGLAIELGPNIRKLIKAFDRVLLIELIGGALITIGVAGELYFGDRQATVQSQLRSKNGELIAYLNDRAAQSEKAAADLGVTFDNLRDFVARKESEANVRMKSFETTANDEIGKLDADTARLGAMRSQSEKALADAKHFLAQEQSALEGLRQAVAWRILTNDSATSLKNVLGTGNGTIAIEYLAADPESLFLAIQLSKVFDAVNTPSKKWDVRAVPRIDTDRVIFDVHVFGPSPRQTSIVKAALSAATVPFTSEEVPLMHFTLGGIALGPGSRETDVVIVVGSREPRS